MQLLAKTFKSYKGIILLVSLIAGIVIGGVKYMFTPGITTTDDYMVTRVFTIKDNEAAKSVGNQPLNYIAVMNTNYNYEQYIKDIDSKKINMAVLNSAWPRLETIDKMNWLRKRIGVGDFREKTYELRFTIPGNSSQDTKLVEKLGNELSDLYLQDGMKTIKKIKPEASLVVEMKHTSIPHFQRVNRKKSALKYGIAGFIAGGIGMIILLLGYAMRKENQNS